jgi:hypothetical protein
MRSFLFLALAFFSGCLAIDPILQPVECSGSDRCESGQLCLSDASTVCEEGANCAGFCVDGGQGCGNETDCGADELCDFSNVNPVCAYDIECGTCTPGDEPDVSCGGFAGDICEEGEACVDDPSDDCDPNNGGADCIGTCEPKTICFNRDECAFDQRCNFEAPSSECSGELTVECGSCEQDPCTTHGADEAACNADTANSCALVECPPNADCAFICRGQN